MHGHSTKKVLYNKKNASPILTEVMKKLAKEDPAKHWSYIPEKHE
jgi:hypothetical protein